MGIIAWKKDLRKGEFPLEQSGILLYHVREIPHNARGRLAGVFQPLAACKNSITRQVTFDFCSSQSIKIPSAPEPLDYAVFP